MRKFIQNIKVISTNKIAELSWLKSSPYFEVKDCDEFSLFKISRREENFVFGEDYEEYFFNMASSADCQLIFEGAIEEINHRKFVYRDLSPKLGKTYSYWIQSKTSPLIGPFPVKIRDPEVWWSYDKIIQELKDLQKAAPDLVQLSTCGQTTHGLDIPSVRLGNGPIAIALVGAIHAGESGPELIIPLLKQLIIESPELLAENQILAIPSVNIDSREAEAHGAPWYIRTNTNGVDLNRNFPANWGNIEYGYGLDSSEWGSVTFRGPTPASASETKAVMSAIEKELPKIVFSYHCLASICGLPALASKSSELDKEYVSRCQYLIEIFGNAFYPESKYNGKRLKFSGTSGSLPTWLYKTFQIPAFDLEIGLDKEALEMCRYDHTDLILLKNYQNRHFNGILALLKVIAKESR